jgi:response regulator of citrate/malate metabolism
VGEIKKVFQCFKELCDGYLVKPIDLTRLMEYMESWDLIKGLGSTRPQVAK